MKTLLACLIVLCASTLQAPAKAYFQTKAEMIQQADVIAIITITAVKPSEAKGTSWTYRKSGEARVETVYKGDIPKAFTIHGEETFICASCPISEGRFLAFLKKDGDLWRGSNWHLSLRPIRGENVEWYGNDDNRYEMKPAPLQTVLDEVKR
jgi:hypothetical protein